MLADTVYKFTLAAIFGTISLISTGCYTTTSYNVSEMRSDSDLMMMKSEITSGFMANPDTNSWYNARENITNALGDRDYDATFSRTFDSLVVAVSSMGISVKNMERRSGYISAQGLSLPPSVKNDIRNKIIRDWATESGFDSSILDQPFKNESYNRLSESHNITTQFLEMERSITFQLVRLDDENTRIKTRFSNVYYPEELEFYYKQIWQEIDKQIFKDENIEGETVETRN